MVDAVLENEAKTGDVKFLTPEAAENVRSECLAELNANTVDLVTSTRRVANCGTEVSLSVLLAPPLDPALVEQYKRKFSYLDSESDD